MDLREDRGRVPGGTEAVRTDIVKMDPEETDFIRVT